MREETARDVGQVRMIDLAALDQPDEAADPGLVEPRTAAHSGCNDPL